MTEDKTVSSSLPQDSGDFFMAPSSYEKEFADEFAALPLKWRRYLTIREDMFAQTVSELQSRLALCQWFEEAFQSHRSELCANGIASAQDWLKGIIALEQEFCRNPAEAVKQLAAAYGVVYPASAPATSSASLQPLDNLLRAKIIEKQLADFALDKDEQGELKHPYYQDVIVDICHLLSHGAAQGLDEAYDMAIWLNQSTRSKLLSQQIQSALKDKTKEAEISKEAAFAVVGKSTPETKPLTLREELEQRFAALGYIEK
ncbi:MAG: hypothetical protein IJ529_00140 [Alphaproteobacteria bacterium]|nr:hypothetical protein [Alphaproteobacteria bacterium]MBQ9235116.1 hypothetical protein [Alphaproteobacteria bacterium]